MNRRDFLVSAAAGSSIPVLNALGGPNMAHENSFESISNRQTAGEDAERRDRLDATELAVMQYVATSSTPEWWRAKDETAGVLERFETEADARESMELDAIEEKRREKIEGFVAETNFDDSTLLYVASVGPTTAHDTVEVTEPERRESETIAKAAVVDGAEDGMFAGSTLTFPSALVRIALEEERLDDHVVRVVDGWEHEHEVRIPRSGRKNSF